VRAEVEMGIIGVVPVGALAYMTAVMETAHQFASGRARKPDLLEMSQGALALLAAAEKIGAFMARSKNEFTKSAEQPSGSGEGGSGSPAPGRLKLGYYEAADLPEGLYVRSFSTGRLEKFEYPAMLPEELMREFWTLFERLFEPVGGLQASDEGSGPA